MSLPEFRRNVPLWRLVSAEGISVAGDWVLITAASIEVYRRTGSTFAVSALLATAAAPAILMAPFAGALADRVDRRRIMVWSDLIVAALLLFGTLLAGSAAIPVAFIAVLAASTSSAFDRPASEALLPSLTNPEDLGRANSALRLGTRISMIAGPAAAAWLIGAGGFDVVLAVDSLTFAASAWLVAAIRTDNLVPALADAGETAYRASLAGISYATRHTNIGAVIATVGVTMLMGAVINAGTVAFVAEELERSTETYGVLLTAEGAGAVALAAILIAVGSRLRFLPLGAVAVVVTGISCVLLAAAPNLAIALAAMVLMGMGTVTIQVAFASYLQQQTEDSFRGRVMSLVAMVAAVGGIAGLALAGPAVAVLGTRIAFTVVGIVIITSVMPVLLVIRRQVREPEPALTVAGR